MDMGTDMVILNMDMGMVMRSRCALGALALAAGVLYGCAPSQQVVAKRTIEEANRLFAEGQYKEAYAKYASANGVEWDSVTFRSATISASAAGMDSAAFAWGKRYCSFGDIEKLKALNGSLLRMGNEESREVLILSDTVSFFNIIGTQPVLNVVARRLAKVQDERLTDLYGRLEEPAVKVEVFDSYFKMARNKLSDKRLEQDCKDVLKSNPDQQTALYFLGKKKYDAAESSYSKLMADYNKNKTQAAYAYLTRDLKKVVTPLYKESKTYFERLRKIDPSKESYIKYLININDRLSNQAEVNRLKKLLK